MRGMELFVLFFIVFIAIVAVAPEAVMQVFLAICWLIMGCFVIFEFGRLAFYGIKALL